MPPSTPKELARRWVPGAGPVDLELQTVGVTNATYRALRDGRRYALRIASASGPPATARGWECRVLAQASLAGLAPQVMVCDPATGILVTEWALGRTWTAAQTLEVEVADAVIRLVRRLQALEPERPVATDPAGWVEHYARAAGDCGMEPSPSSLERRRLAGECLARLAALPAARPVLCHGDLHRHNVVVGEELRVIDWEFARMSDPLWDFAGWVAMSDGSDDFAALLLDRHLERAAAAHETLRLQLLVWLYDYVCLAWSELYLYRLEAARPSAGAPACGAHGADVAARAVQLAARLCRVPGSRARQVPAN